jgi:DNA-binding response OmpR family regulator
MSVHLAGNTILILERDVHAAHALRAILEAAHADVTLAIGSADALGRIGRFKFDAAILDGIGCTEVCKALGDTPFMFFVLRRQTFHDWRDAPVLVKPVREDMILAAVSRLLGISTEH